MASPGFRKRDRFLVLTRPARLALRGEPHALAVYCALMDRVSGTEGSVRPSYDTIAEDSGVSRRQVSVALTVLERLGLIEREHRSGPNGRTSNMYEVASHPRAQDALTGGQDVPLPQGTTSPNPRAGDALEEEPVGEEPVGEDRAAAPSERTKIETVAWTIAKDVHATRQPPPPNVKNTMTIALRFVECGKWTVDVIREAMIGAATCTFGSVEIQLSRAGPQVRQPRRPDIAGNLERFREPRPDPPRRHDAIEVMGR